MIVIPVESKKASQLLVIIEPDNLERMKKGDPITLHSAGIGGTLSIAHPENFQLVIAYEEVTGHLYELAGQGDIRGIIRHILRGFKFKEEDKLGTQILTWTCHVCHRERENSKISVYSKPVVINGKEVPGATQNVRYCNDNPDCVDKARNFDFFKKKGGEEDDLKKLDMQHKHILNLTARDAGPDGWTPVSEKLFPVLSQNMPSELIEFEKTPEGGRARLTEEGKNVHKAMKWL